MTSRDQKPRRIGIIAGGGTLPLAVAKAVATRGDLPVLFALTGYCDPASVVGQQHHWIALGQFGRLVNLMRAENCRDALFIGSLVRPALWEVRFDFRTLLAIPAIIAAFRGGDDHLLTTIARIF